MFPIQDNRMSAQTRQLHRCGLLISKAEYSKVRDNLSSTSIPFYRYRYRWWCTFSICRESWKEKYMHAGVMCFP